MLMSKLASQPLHLSKSNNVLVHNIIQVQYMYVY